MSSIATNLELRTLVPGNMIQDFAATHPNAALRLAIYVATGGLNKAHPWRPYVARITTYTARLFAKDLSNNQTGNIVITLRLVMLMLQEIGIIADYEWIETDRGSGFAVYPNPLWLEDQLTNQPENQFVMTNYDYERSRWNGDVETTTLRHLLQEMSPEQRAKMMNTKGLDEHLYKDDRNDDDASS